VIVLYSIFEKVFSWIQKLGVSGFTNYYLVFQVGLFLVMTILLFMFISKEIKTMKMVKAMLKDLDPSDTDVSNIDQQINTIFKELKDSRYKKLWERYYNRVKTKDEDEKIKVDSFFSEEVLYHQMGYRSWMDTGAGISVSIGVLGTFIGLSTGLADLNVGDTDSLRSGIDSLLGGMKVAFYTSVFGVFLSLVWTFYDRFLSQRLERDIDWHAERLDYLLSTDDEELFLNRLEKVTRNQADHLKTLLTDAMEKAMQPMVNQIQQSQGQVKDAFTQLSSQFENINSGMESQSKLLESQIEITKSNGTDMTDRLIDQITGGTEESITQFSQLIQDTQNMQQQMMGTINQVVDSFSVTQQKQTETTEQTERMFARFEKMSEQLEGMSGSYQQASSYMSGLSDQIQSIQNLTQQQLPLQQDVLKSNQLLAQRYDEVTTGFSEFNDKAESKHNELLTKLIDVSSEMSTNYKGISNGFTQTLDVQKQTLTESNDLLVSVKEIVDSIIPVAPELNNIINNISTLSDKLDELQSLQNKLLPAQQEIAVSNNQLATKYDSLTEGFKKFNEEIENKHHILIDQVTTVSSTMTETYKDMTDQFKQTLTIQENSLKDSDELLQSVKEAVTNLLPVAPELREVVQNIDVLKDQLVQTQQLQSELLPEMINMRKDTNEAVQEALVTTGSYINEISNQVTTLQTHWNSTKEQFIATRETLDTSVKGFGENIDSGLSKTFDHVDKTLTKAVSEVSNLVNQFSDVQGELLEGLEELSDVMSKGKEVVQQ
jgi:methyl-accepting chemotaxis protein